MWRVFFFFFFFTFYVDKFIPKKKDKILYANVIVDLIAF